MRVPNVFANWDIENIISKISDAVEVEAFTAWATDLNFCAIRGCMQHYSSK